jgi:hypothetical protein
MKVAVRCPELGAARSREMSWRLTGLVRYTNSSDSQERVGGHALLRCRSRPISPSGSRAGVCLARSIIDLMPRPAATGTAPPRRWRWGAASNLPMKPPEVVTRRKDAVGALRLFARSEEVRSTRVALLY